jgi:predicted RecB family nuclease
MYRKISEDVLLARQHCRLKAYFRLCGEHGTKCDFETLLLGARNDARAKATEKIQRQQVESRLVTDLALSRPALRQGAAFILRARLDDDHYAIEFDGLRRVTGASALGEFHYRPVMFSESQRVRRFERQFLASLGVVLSRIQGVVPEGGFFYLGRECVVTSIRFGNSLRAGTEIVRDVERTQRAGTAPKLLLNDHCRVCKFRERCHSQAIADDNLSLLRGLGEKAIKKYSRRGVLTLTQLAHMFRPRRRGKRSDKPPKVRDHALHALAIRDKNIYVLGKPQIPTGLVRIYLDVESNPEQGFVYLIGMVICDRSRVECHTFWENDRKEESRSFDQFIYVTCRFEDSRIYCYGTYEKAFIIRMRRHARSKKKVDAALEKLTNVLGVVYPHFYFPVHSNGLKDVAGYLGFQWTEPDASGIQSIAWHMNWERTGDNCWKSKLIQYNSEDCHALRRVTEFLAASSDAAHQAEEPKVSSVTDLDRLSRTVTWGKYVHEDFEFINKMAYFDYQRTRVFVRTSPILKKHGRRRQHRRSWKNRGLRANHRVEVTASKCPLCRSKEIIDLPSKRKPKSVQTRSKRAFDIVITPSSVKRKVIDVRAVAYRCLRCKHCFVSGRYERLARHFHGFMSWSVYHQITRFATIFGVFACHRNKHLCRAVLIRGISKKLTSRNRQV